MSCVLWVMFKFEKFYVRMYEMMYLMMFGWCMVNLNMFDDWMVLFGEGVEILVDCYCIVCDE